MTNTGQGLKDWQVNMELPVALVQMDWTSTRQEGQERRKTSTRRQGVDKVSTRGQDQASIQGEVNRRSTRDRVSTRGKGSTKVEMADEPVQE